jgi:hypothetical protein
LWHALCSKSQLEKLPASCCPQLRYGLKFIIVRWLLRRTTRELFYSQDAFPLFQGKFRLVQWAKLEFTRLEKF